MTGPPDAHERRRRRGVLAAPAAYAAALLAAQPAAAALPTRYWLAICSGDGTHWLALPTDPLRRGDRPAPDREHGLCAHANCPGERRPAERGRPRF